MITSSPLNAVAANPLPGAPRTPATPRANDTTASRLDDRSRAEVPLVGETPAVCRLLEQIGRIAPTDVPVLIEGETGTGKELVARALHRQSPRRERPFVAVNCAELTPETAESRLFGHRKGSFTGAHEDHKGFFEVAERGTLFLDEVGELSLPIQAKLLRTLQEGEIVRFGESHPRRINVRIVAATNRCMDREVAAGHVRADLLYRLRVLPLHVPPLRERREDVLLLARHFLAKHARKLRLFAPAFSPEALSVLEAYDFPGNVRELEHLMIRAIVMCAPGRAIEAAELRALLTVPSQAMDPTRDRTITTALAPARQGDLATAVARYERELIERALAGARGNKSQAARVLGISRRWLLTKLKAYRIDLPTDAVCLTS